MQEDGTRYTTNYMLSTDPRYARLMQFMLPSEGSVSGRLLTDKTDPSKTWRITYSPHGIQRDTRYGEEPLEIVHANPAGQFRRWEPGELPPAARVTPAASRPTTQPTAGTAPVGPAPVADTAGSAGPSETTAAPQEPTTPANPAEARLEAYSKIHGKRPEWTKETPAESIWSDPTFQSNALTGLGVGLLGGLGGYALTGGQGGLAPWLMLGGGVGAGIGGLSGYNQWNANKTEYDDFLKKQKAWDAGLAAGTPVGMLEDGTPVTQEDVDSGNVQVVRSDEKGKPVYEIVEQGLKGISVPGKTGTRVDDKGGVWTEDGQERLPAEKDFAAKATYDKTPFIGTGVGQLGGEMQNGQMRYYGFVKPYPSAGNPLARDHHAYWVTDETRPLGGYIVYAYPKGELTNNPADYTWYKEGGGYWNLQKPMELSEVAALVANTSLDPNQAHLLDRSAAAKERLKQHANSRTFSTWGMFDNETLGYDPYGDGSPAWRIPYTPDNSGE